MHTQVRAPRRRRGLSLVEMTVASTIIVGLFGAAVPVMSSISSAGEDGRSRSWTQADNRQALMRISRDVMNGSMTATDTLGNPRFTVTTGNARSSLSGHLGNASGGSGGTTAAGQDPAGHAYGWTIGNNNPHANSANSATASLGSGARGGTHIGRDRSTTLDADEYSAGAGRPRDKFFTANSVLGFQKILNYSWGADGEPVINWGPWVEYRVENRELVRTENGGNRVVVSPNCSGFLVETTTANTIVITLVTERRSRDGKGVTSQANQVEVVPKN